MNRVELGARRWILSHYLEEHNQWRLHDRLWEAHTDPHSLLNLGMTDMHVEVEAYYLESLVIFPETHHPRA